MKSTTNPAVAKIARDLEALMDELRPAAESDPVLAFASLMLGLHDVLDRLEALDVPPVSGGSPEADDYEELCPEFIEDPEGWPEAFDDEADGYRWEPTPDYTGETPAEVLAASVPFNGDYDAWLDRLDAARDCWTEADQILAHGCA